MTEQQAKLFRTKLDSVIEELDDETALDVQTLFPEWRIKDYTVGDRVRHGELLYKCVQAHTAQSDWTPDITPALWTRVSIDEFPEWIQPTGAQDAYRLGAKVSHNGKHWISDIDFNTYEPGVYGWSEV